MAQQEIAQAPVTHKQSARGLVVAVVIFPSVKGSGENRPRGENSTCSCLRTKVLRRQKAATSVRGSNITVYVIGPEDDVTFLKNNPIQLGKSTVHYIPIECTDSSKKSEKVNHDIIASNADQVMRKHKIRAIFVADEDDDSGESQKRKFLKRGYTIFGRMPSGQKPKCGYVVSDVFSEESPPIRWSKVFRGLRRKIKERRSKR